MTAKALLLSLLAMSTPAFAQDESAAAAAAEALSQFPETAPPHQVLIHPHRQQRDSYLWGTFGPPGILDATVGAGVGQWLDTPAEWEQTRAGYFKRFATEYTESAINASTRYVLARIRDEDPSFKPCGCSGIRRRAWHAIVSPLVAYRYDDGRMQFSAARMAGTATSGIVSGTTWKPGTPTAGTIAAHVGTDLLSAMGVDLLREFVFRPRNAH